MHPALLLYTGNTFNHPSSASTVNLPVFLTSSSDPVFFPFQTNGGAESVGDNAGRRGGRRGGGQGAQSYGQTLRRPRYVTPRELEAANLGFFSTGPDGKLPIKCINLGKILLFFHWPDQNSSDIHLGFFSLARMAN